MAPLLMSDPVVRSAASPTGAVEPPPTSGQNEKPPLALPPQLLGNLSALPAGRLMPVALQTMRRQHGGLGWFFIGCGESSAPGAPLQAEILHRSTAEDDGRSLAGNMSATLQRAALQASIQALKTRILAEAEVPLFGQKVFAEACPVIDRGKLLGAVCRVSLQQKKVIPAASLLQCLAQLAVLASVKGEAERERNLFQQVAALFELFSAASSGTDFPECASQLANHLRDILGCDLVAIAIREHGRHKLAAVSGLAQSTAERTAGRAALEACIRDAMHHRQTRRFLREDSAPDGSVQEVREWFDPALAIASPLEDADSNLRGGWLFLWHEVPTNAPGLETLIKAAAPEVASLLHLLRRAKPGPFAGTLRRIWLRASANQRRLAAAGAIAALVTLLFPVPYPVKAASELHPVTRRVVTAPFDGILERSRVKAGDTVKAGQVLAEMEGRELNWQIADASARRARAMAEADQLLATGKVAESKMAELDASSLEQEITLLHYRTAHLLVKAPLDGVVLQGDLERSEGAHLGTGDPLFEVGPLDRLIVEVAVRETDISLLRDSAAVEITLESFPGETFRAPLLRVAPRSEAIEGSNVFICEVELPNPEGRLRPGLKGKARIEGPHRPLAWSWLRDPWNALRYHL